ncbi:MDR family MFS transporter [Herbiconiux sp. KACC 21604]|uniref:MDR family MFS transporter n=1 Tax=unclassified Herbiconiux TaxID=2618217 RepID=UPI001491A8B7|nr:MDR family MFS transporter [Herbiconiux sp. SALV-R1]QJU55185.1 multidrug efflux MFS transporter [Herbiconiux sp. SALV-R1]WPO86347.1 MDR family MFS transporter [Herbiconiux sp. KACC 21604]
MDKNLRRLAVALVVGAMAPLFDATIVSVALHTLAGDLNASIETIQWVSTGYLLAMGVTVPLVGWLQNRLGGRRLWMAALVVFLVGSILCSLAWDAGSLIAFRVVQGVGAGAMMPLLTTLLMQAARGQALGRTMAVVSLPTALGPILGPVIGGLLLGAGAWPWLFWVNVPFAAVALVLAWRFIPADGPTGTAKLDVVGLTLLSPAVVGLLYGLSNAGSAGGFARFDVWAPLAAGVALLVAFTLWATRTTRPALVDLRLLRHRPLAAASGAMFLMGAALYGGMLLLPLSFQELRGTDALGAGLLLIPQGVGSLLSRSLAGRLTDRIGARTVAILGFAVVLVATIPFAFADASTNLWWISAVLVVRGMGLGAVMIPIMAVGFVGLEQHEIPHASTITRLSQQLGGAFGTAVLAVVLAGAAAGGGAAGGGADAVAAFQQSFWWAIAITGVALLLSFLLPGRTAVADAEEKPETATAGAVSSRA